LSVLAVFTDGHKWLDSEDVVKSLYNLIMLWLKI